MTIIMASQRKVVNFTNRTLTKRLLSYIKISVTFDRSLYVTAAINSIENDCSNFFARVVLH